jgi:hypothetical protein
LTSFARNYIIRIVIMVTSVLKLVVIYGDDDYGEHIVAATAAAANYPFDVVVDVDVVSRSCLFVCLFVIVFILFQLFVVV